MIAATACKSGFKSSGASFAHVDGRMAVPPLRPSLLISLSRTFSFCGVSQSGPCRQPRCSRRLRALGWACSGRCQH